MYLVGLYFYKEVILKILIVTNEEQFDSSLNSDLLTFFKRADEIVSDIIFHDINEINDDKTLLNNYNIIFCFSDTKDTIVSLFQSKKNIHSFESSFNPFYDKQLNLLIAGVSFKVSELKTTTVANKKLIWSLMQDVTRLGKNLPDTITPVFEKEIHSEETKVDVNKEALESKSIESIPSLPISILSHSDDLKIVIHSLESIVNILKKYTH